MKLRAPKQTFYVVGILLALLLNYSVRSQPCIGVPVAGTITGADSICPYRPLTLSLSGFSTTSGITFQWLSSAPGTGSFTPIPGATSTVLSLPLMGASTDYRVEVTCSLSGGTATSATHAVYLKQFYECYCDTAGLGGSTYFINIDSVSIAGTTLNNYTPGSTSIYSIFPPTGSTTAHIQAGGLYPVYINTGYHPGYTPTSIVWMDHNRDGIYAAGEGMIFEATWFGVSSVLFSVPVTAQQGLAGMRVRTVVDTLDLLTCAKPCDSFITGETQDYIITIDSASPCSTLLPGTIAGPDSVCSGKLFTLWVAGYGGIADITYQWKSRASGVGAFTNIPGATDSRYMAFGSTTATDFEVVVKCPSTSATATSPVFTLYPKKFYDCYCSPDVSTYLVNDFKGKNMVAGISVPGTSLNAAGMMVPNSYSYIKLPPTPSSNTANLSIGSSHTMIVRIDSANYHPQEVGVWIDVNRNGIFDPSEFTLLDGTPTGGTFKGSLVIPAGSLTGVTGMRVAVSDSAIPITPPCARLSSGEVVDLTVTIDTAHPVTASELYSNEAVQIAVVPNPVKNNMVVGLSKEGRYTFKVLDVFGRVLLTESTTGNKVQFSLSDLTTGVYLLKCEGEGFVQIVRVNKE